MVNLFFDIETVPNFDSSQEYLEVKKLVDEGLLNEKSPQRELFWKYQIGSLNPFDGKVILITYKIDDGHLFFLKEWEDGERGIVDKFLNLVRDLEYHSTSQEHLKIIGQNIRGFDLVFLFERLRFYYPDKERLIYHSLIKKPEIMDFIQIHIPLNNFQIKGLNYEVLAHAYDFQTIKSQPKQVASNYYNKEFEKIEEYSKNRFIYPELYKRMLKSNLVSKETLEHSIKFIESQRDEAKAG